MTRKLRTVPDTPPRAVLYLRQSVSRDDSISLDLQEAAGREYCTRQGYQVVAVESDPGLTGRTWKRPAVQRTIAMIEDGAADVIVLWKWSRLSRSRRDWAIAADKVDVAGGRIESATEAVDVSTATGRLARGVLTEFAAFESDRIGEVWKEVHASRLADGYAPNGKPRFGYVWDQAQKLHVPDPVTGPVLAEAYDRYIAGASIYSLVRWLNAERVTTTGDRPWTDHALRRVLDAGFGAGRILWQGQAHPGRHERVVNDDTWQAYLDARARRRRTPARTVRSKYVLSGLVRCARCSGPMVANPRTNREVSLRCATAKERGPEACAGGYVGMHVVEAAVLDWLRDVAEIVEAAEETARRGVQRRVSAESEIAVKQRRLREIEDAVQRLTMRLAEGVLASADYAAAVGAYKAEQSELEVKVAELGAQARAATIDRQHVATGLLADWHKLPVEGRRDVLVRLISRVVVTTGPRGGVPGVQNGASSAIIEVVGA